jgi:hypothetical protein
MTGAGQGDESLQGLIYVAGYGRSGSTLFGRLLAQRDGVLDLGEVAFSTPHLGSKSRRCICGEAVADCPVWCCVPAQAVDQDPLPANPESHARVLETVFSETPHDIVVDSSKTARNQPLRPFRLLSRLSIPMTVIHLVRDPRGVFWSILKDRQRGDGEPSHIRRLALAARVSAAWWLANISADLFRLVHGRTVLMHYERALRRGPPEALQPLLGPMPLEGQPLDYTSGNHHAVAGNRMRRRRQDVVRLDDSWRENLDADVSGLIFAMCLPLMLRYGLLRLSFPRLLPTGHIDGKPQ